MTNASINPLFTPVQLGALSLPNRILMAPMTRSRATNPELASGALQAKYYAQRASAGLIVTEGTQVAASGIGYIATPGIHTDAQAAGWREVTTAVHAAGGRISAQLWHVGRISHSDLLSGQAPVAPSAIPAVGQSFTFEGPKDFSTPRELSSAEVVEVIGQFEHGARVAKAAGFDGIQLHGANGYLIDQFLRSASNQRTDGYGGSLANRLRFLTEVTDAVAGVFGADRVSVRLSPNNVPFNSQQDDDPKATFSAAAAALSTYGLAYLEGVNFLGPAGFELHDALREAFQGNYVANGGFTAETGEQWLRDERATAISFGTPFIANPDLPERFRRGVPLAEADKATFYQGGAEGFITYPALQD